MPIFAIARHAPEYHGVKYQQEIAQRAALRLSGNLVALGLVPAAKRLILSSPVKRARITADVFAVMLDSPVLEDSAFDDRKDPDIVRDMIAGGDILEKHLKYCGLVVLITHTPLVEPLFYAVTRRLLKHSNGFSPPNLTFGVHAINLETHSYVSFGTL